MVAGRIYKDRSFNSVAAGSTATVEMPTLGIYQELLLTYGTGTSGGANQTNMEAEINEIRLVVNGVVQRRMSAAELFAINQYHGQAVVTGQLPIFLAEPWRRTAQGEDALGWGMADVGSFVVEVDIDSGASSPTLEISSERVPGSVNMGPIVKWRRHTITIGATGENVISTLPKSDNYLAMHCASANIDDVRVSLDGANVYEGTAAQLEHYAEKYGKTWQSSYFHIDASRDNRVSSVLAMKRPDGSGVRDFEVMFNMGSASSFSLIAETVGYRD
jgi:hypothetical protein